MDEKFCPLLLPVINRDGVPVQCKRERCAWWHVYGKPNVTIPGRCALVSIADALMDINMIGVAVDNK